MAEGDVASMNLHPYWGDNLGSQEPFTIKQKGNYSEVQPKNDLRPGRYCFVEGNPLRSYYAHPWWCFDVAGQVVQQNDRDLDVAPPAVGVYLVDDGKAVQLPAVEITAEVINRAFVETFYRFLADGTSDSTKTLQLDTSRLPSTANPNPIVITNLNIRVPDLSLYPGQVGIGLNWKNLDGYLTVTHVRGGLPAKKAGIAPYDIVLAVDDQEVNGRQS
jgi:hypothetical protein